MRTDERTRRCAKCDKLVHAIESAERCPPPHKAVWRCPTCNQHMGFVAQAKADGDPKREATHRELVAKYGRGFCELCLLSTVDLLDDNKYLVGHHVKQYADDGSSERENVWIVCNSCHSLIHWARHHHGAKAVADVA